MIKDVFPTLNNGWQAPTILDLSEEPDMKKLYSLKTGQKVVSVHDEIRSAINELFDIVNPAKKDSRSSNDLEQFAEAFGNLDEYGRWVFFPWSGRLVHFPPEADLRRLRTSRNRNLVTEEEQAKLYDATICVIGMSVGSNVVEALVAGGIGGKLILADMDHLEPSNLNRIRAPFHHVGLHKVDAIARKVSEIDPFIEQIHYRNGVTEKNISEIISKHKPDLIIDEMDNIQMKLKLRLAARKAGIPVIMAADDGDGVLIDIERYDSNHDLPILHGLIPPEVIERILNETDLPRQELGMLIGKYFVGFENTPLRMFESLTEVGKSLPSWPQLGGAAALAGVILAYISKRILTGAALNSGRHLFTPDELFNPEINSEAYQNKVKRIIGTLNP